MRSKKSQFEIFGVVLIVIILVLAMFFMIGNSLKKKKDVTQSFTDSELGQNTLTSLMRMQVEDCSADTFAGIVKFCVNEMHDQCGSQVNTCKYIKDLLKDIGSGNPGIFDETLEEWGKKYRFSILIKKKDDPKEYDLLIDPFSKSDQVDDIPIMSEKPCTKFSEKEAPGVIPLPRPRGSNSDPDIDFSGPIIVKLEICK